MDDLIDLDELRELLAKRTDRRRIMRRIVRAVLVACAAVMITVGILWLAPAVLP